MSGPVPYPESTPPQGIPGIPPFAGTYPGALPPPVPYPKRNRWRVVLLAAVGAVAVIAVTIGAVLGLSGRDDEAPVAMNAENVRPAIQGFLDALTDGDDEAIARNTLCGLYDAVEDRNSDLALADLSSDGFRKQFLEVEVTSVDKVVPWSTNQAQALFTLTVVQPGTGRGAPEAGTRIQVVAQLLQSDDQILVCSYVQRAS